MGTGLMGSSVGLALQRVKPALGIDEIIGYDRDAGRAARALERGAVDRTAERAIDAVRAVSLIIVAVPVGAARALFAEIAPGVGATTIVTDLGSTKQLVCDAAATQLPTPQRFVGAHPIAGSEQSGPDAASAELFRGRLCILTPATDTDPDALRHVTDLWRALHAELFTMSPAEHDRTLALTSHLPHAAVFALGAAVAECDPELPLTGRGGTGFSDVMRLAASDPALWSDVFLANRTALAPALARLGDEVQTLADAIAREDRAAVRALIDRARRGRARVLGE